MNKYGSDRLLIRIHEILTLMLSATAPNALHWYVICNALCGKIDIFKNIMNDTDNE